MRQCSEGRAVQGRFIYRAALTLEAAHYALPRQGSLKGNLYFKIPLFKHLSRNGKPGTGLLTGNWFIIHCWVPTMQLEEHGYRIIVVDDGLTRQSRGVDADEPKPASLSAWHDLPLKK